MSNPDTKKASRKQPLRIGITGGMGSGKTTVCKIFEALGVPVYYADDRAKAIMTENETVKAEIIALFGEEAYFPDGSLNRKFISSAAFGDQDKLTRLNSIVHPAVLRDGEHWQARNSHAIYTLKEAALLFESGSHQVLDKIITVYAPQEIRIERVMKRDGASRQQVWARMSRQMPDEEKIRLSDFTIFNDGSQSLVKQVLDIHRQLIAPNKETEEIATP